jgi:hypothetical protein
MTIEQTKTSMFLLECENGEMGIVNFYEQFFVVDSITIYSREINGVPRKFAVVTTNSDNELIETKYLIGDKVQFNGVGNCIKSTLTKVEVIDGN